MWRYADAGAYICDLEAYMRSQAAFALIHSPLVGPSTWLRVADALQADQIAAFVPSLIDCEADARPYWQQHAHAVARELASVPAHCSLILVGHSGAGPLLPSIRQILPQRVSAYLFVDAGLPHNGASRLDLLATESPKLATQLQHDLEAGRRFPAWTDDQLRTIIPNQRYRQQLLAELQPRALPFFKEPIPVFSEWPDAPCAYIQFSTAYDSYVRFAQHAGWFIRILKADHFHMLVEPEIVAHMLVETVQKITP